MSFFVHNALLPAKLKSANNLGKLLILCNVYLFLFSELKGNITREKRKIESLKKFQVILSEVKGITSCHCRKNYASLLLSKFFLRERAQGKSDLYFKTIFFCSAFLTGFPNNYHHRFIRNSLLPGRYLHELW